MTGREFHDPPWDDPLDVEAEYAAIPASATTKGMFNLPMVAEAVRRGIVLREARERYLPFADYPLLEHARLLVEAAGAFFPDVNTRRGLRKIGRAAHRAITETTIGRVMWAAAHDVPSGLEVAAKTYAVTSPSTRVTILECGPGRACLRLEGAHCFRDSNHVGTFEGILRACQAKTGRVAVRLEEEPGAAEFLLEWTVETISTRPPFDGDPLGSPRSRSSRPPRSSKH